MIVADNGASIGGEDGDPTVARETAAALGKKAIAFADSVASPGVAKSAGRAGGEEFRRHRHRGEQRRHPARRLRLPRRSARLGRGDPQQPVGRVLPDQRRLGGDARPGQDRAAAAPGGYDWGRIVNIVSSAGLYGNLGQAAYASAKAGLFGLTRVTAMDLARAQITANAVAPFARTRVTDIIQPANEAQKSYKERALKIGAHHVANLVTALCSPAGKGITGQLLGVRGREVFLFGQPRPVARIEAECRRSRRISAPSSSDKFTDLTTDLEAFNTEPLV